MAGRQGRWWTHIHMHTRMHTHMYTHAHTHMHTCTHMHTHTHTHMHTHTHPHTRTPCLIHHAPDILCSYCSIGAADLQPDWPRRFEPIRQHKHQHLVINLTYLYGLSIHIQSRNLTQVVPSPGSAQEYPQKSSGKQSGMPHKLPLVLDPPPPPGPAWWCLFTSDLPRVHSRSLKLWILPFYHHHSDCRTSQASEVSVCLFVHLSIARWFCVIWFVSECYTDRARGRCLDTQVVGI